MPETVPASSSGRIVELSIGRTRHHAADIRQTFIGPKTRGAPGQVEPDRTLLLQTAREGAIVDNLGLDRGYAADPLQRLAPHQHAAAGRRGEPAFPVGHPGKGGKASGRRRRRQESGNALPNADTIVRPSKRQAPGPGSRHAQRGSADCPACDRCRHRSKAGSPADRSTRWRAGCPDAGPTLCPSSRWAGRPLARRPTVLRRRLPPRPKARSAVPSSLPSSTSTDVKGAWIVLPQQACDRLADHVCLVACRNNGRHGWPPRGVGRAGRGRRARAPARSRPGRPTDKSRSPTPEGQDRSTNSCQVACFAEPCQGVDHAFLIGAAAIPQLALGLRRCEEHMVAGHP